MKDRDRRGFPMTLKTLLRTARDGARGLTPMLALSLAIAAAGCAYSIVQGGAVDQSRADQVETGIQKLRGLDFTAKVPLIVRTRDQAQQMLIKEIARDHTDAELRTGGETGSMVGLYPPAMDLKAEALRLLREQIAGFYDPHGKEMVLVQGNVDLGFWNSAAEFVNRRDVVGEMLLAHELTHALQDQHFQIEKMLDKVNDNDDRTLALKSVAEGDATLAGFGYVAGNLDAATIDTVVSHLADLPRAFNAQSEDVPIGLSAPMLFQYAEGTRFVAEAYRRGGWAAINAIYHNPPRSSLQIMEPELYFDRFTPPAKIDLSGYQGVLKGWTKSDDDTYGAFLIKVILQRSLGREAPALELVRRWAGDRIIVLRKGDALTVLWLIAFRDERSAQEFSEVYGDLLDHLRGENNLHQVDCHASAVLIAIGPGAGQFAQLAPAVWKASTITRVMPAAPSLPIRTAVPAHHEAAALAG
ncbi:MAG: hypothetical protein ACREQN_08950 [Candidatus Binataceae bacterium]